MDNLRELVQQNKSAILFTGGDFNLPDINWNYMYVTGNQYQVPVSPTWTLLSTLVSNNLWISPPGSIHTGLLIYHLFKSAVPSQACPTMLQCSSQPDWDQQSPSQPHARLSYGNELTWHPSEPGLINLLKSSMKLTPQRPIYMIYGMPSPRPWNGSWRTTYPRSGPPLHTPSRGRTPL